MPFTARLALVFQTKPENNGDRNLIEKVIILERVIAIA